MDGGAVLHAPTVVRAGRRRRDGVPPTKVGRREGQGGARRDEGDGGRGGTTVGLPSPGEEVEEEARRPAGPLVGRRRRPDGVEEEEEEEEEDGEEEEDDDTVDKEEEEELSAPL